MALDEIEAIEAAYTHISQEAPPRFSISTVSSSGLQRKADDWEVLLDPDLKPQLDALGNILKDVWSEARPNPPIALATSASPGARLLSLDGGGVRGVSSLMILEAIMKKVCKIENPQGGYPDGDMKVHQYFQLAAGTSTGGLAAVMLFRLRMSVPEAIKAYKNFAEAIFEPKIFGWQFKKLGAFGLALGNFWLKLKMVFNQARYDPAALEDKIKEIVGNHPLGSNGAKVKLLDPERCSEDGKM
jgi:Patatin-like phospholipase